MKLHRNFVLVLGIVITALLLIGGIALILHTDRFDPRPIATSIPMHPVYADSTQPIEVRAADLVSYMTLEEKIGQMTLVEKNSILKPSDVATYHIGALLSGAGAKPKKNTAAGWKEMIDDFQATAKQTRLGIPLLYGVDAIHGHALVPGATVFPHAIGLGATHNPQLVEEVARATAQELLYTGVQWSFSPNLDQPQDIRWGRVYETFSDDPALVSQLGVAYLSGLQIPSNTRFAHDERIAVLATTKHYLGLGGMQWGTSLNDAFTIDQGVTVADDEALRAIYLPPFRAAIDAGALSIMVGLNTWGEKRMVRQKELLTQVLKDELGFTGFIVSDWYGVHEGRNSSFLATVQAVNAGVDMVMLPFDYQRFARDMKWGNRLGLISDERIDDAATRILRVKFALGLFDQPEEILPFDSFGSLEHRTLARRAVAESLVLLKNNNGLLPLSSHISRIRVAVSAADNIGMQLGAWSIEWQGVNGNWPPGATSILSGITARVGPETTVEYDQGGNFTSHDRVPVGIAVVGETPYAEGWGDTAYPTLSNEDIQAIQNLQSSSENVVVILVSGRPLFITDEIDGYDALVAAWLPGSEGAGVADALFGDAPFVGTLPLPWPRHVKQLPIATDGTTADETSELFPRYYGLTYYQN